MTNQLLPPLTETERQDLERSIREFGVIMPVILDLETGETVDGHHRLEIAKALDVEYPLYQHRFKDKAERIRFILDLNLARRHLSEEDRSRLRAEYAKERQVRRGLPAGPGRGHKKTTEAASVVLPPLLEAPDVPPSVEEVAAELGVTARTLRTDLRKADEREGKPPKPAIPVRPRPRRAQAAPPETAASRLRQAVRTELEAGSSALELAAILQVIYSDLLNGIV